jgi:hypothetical protein
LRASKYSADPSETDPYKLSDATIRYRLCVKNRQPAVEWKRISQNGLNSMAFNEDQRTASYTSPAATGGQVFTDLTFDVARDRSQKKVCIRFFRNGLLKVSEPITSLSTDTLKNETDGHVYVRQMP